MNEIRPDPSAASGDSFAATRWTLVLRARGDSEPARAALGELCGAYWNPVFRFLRAEGCDEDAARERAQEFFARILSGRGFDGATPERGRFRSFLLGALKHYLADRRDRECAAKRGGGAIPESLRTETDTSPGHEVASRSDPDPGVGFDRQWAYAVMDRALTALEREQASAGRETHFQVLKPWLAGDGVAGTTLDASRQLEMSEGAVKVAIHRLRRRFRELVRHEVAQTVPASDDVDEEIRYLIQVLSR
ncbi:MAG: sigma-70 family RNA polymerase sigma factor [Verrucomicrobiales bacterium]|nr:sigma-70 family RNA polymerase sigma factor [Verrucomicrobiales bacterium]